MYFLYNLVVRFSWLHLRLIALFHPKIKLFVNGRKNVFEVLEKNIAKNDKVFWIHVSSLGEFEQGLPIIEKLKEAYTDHKILVTFFSPSGYEVKKNTPMADLVIYLPLDSRKNSERFIELAHPKLAIFVKYEIWPNYLKQLRQHKIPTLLVSAIFKKNQIFFKSYGGFMQKALRTYNHIFLQDEPSYALLKTIGIENTSISGDTRLDRVSEIVERDNHLPFMEQFKKDRPCFVAGSTWPEDEAILIDYINNAPKNLKYVLAPHTVKHDKILGLAGAITKKKVLYSKMDVSTLDDYEVIIIDHIGLLTKIYSYADIAYVGGGFATGLHNTLEPAVFGIPVIIGPNFSGFKEAEDLVAQKGVLPISSSWEFGELMKKLLDHADYRLKTGQINASYIAKNKGASIQIMDFIHTLN